MSQRRSYPITMNFKFYNKCWRALRNKCVFSFLPECCINGLDVRPALRQNCANAVLVCIIRVYGALPEHQLLIQCWFNVGPPSATLVQH